MSKQTKSLELFKLEGRSPLVTGGGRGLGKVMAQALAEAGADVAIASRDEESCAATAAEMGEATGRRVVSGKLDVSEKGSVDAFVEHVAGAFEPMTS